MKIVNPSLLSPLSFLNMLAFIYAFIFIHSLTFLVIIFRSKHLGGFGVMLFLKFLKTISQTSNQASVHFGLPWGSITWKMLFNLYDSDLLDSLPNSQTTFHHAGDTTIIKSCRPTKFAESTENFNSALKALSSGSSDSHLALDPTNSKSVLPSASQMARVYCLRDISF